MTALARRNVPAARIVTADATEIEFPAGGFDAIVSFFGQTMYWSNFGPERYRRLLAETGFRIEREGVVGGGFAGAEADEEIPPILLAGRL